MPQTLTPNSRPVSADPSLYRIDQIDTILSPGLVVFRDLVQRNIGEMIRIAGSTERLRPHAKTHKMEGVIRMLLDAGITRHKCATIAEAEMIARAGASDIFIAYQLVGPNIARLVKLLDTFPAVRFAVACDDPLAVEALSAALANTPHTVDVVMDLDTGMHRTGIEPDGEAVQLYEMIAAAPHVRAAGLHWYDGHLRQSDVDERRRAVDAGWEKLMRLRDALMVQGLDVPQVIACGTGSFPILAEKDEPNLQLSPGTVVFYDAGYRQEYPDLDFTPALGVVTRVVSRRRDDQITVDLGHKAVAPDKPFGHRVWFPTVPDAEEIHHTEEHLVIRTQQARQFAPGDPLVAIPRHVCPTCALHSTAAVVSSGQIVDGWQVAARERVISI